jgi:predicted nucleotidyltransferase
MVELNQILEYFSKNKERFSNDYHLKRIGVFGSVAREEQNEQSDLDIIVEFEEGTAKLYILKEKLKKELQFKFKAPVDICREKYINPVFRYQILKEAKYA